MMDPGRFTRVQNSFTVATGRFEAAPTVASATPHVKGSWVSQITTANFDVYFVAVLIADSFVSTADSRTLADIGYDPAGGTSYTVVVPNILVGGASSAVFSPKTFYCPVFIPKGSQIATRIQSVVVSNSVRIGLVLVGGLHADQERPHRGAIQDYGTNTATSGGTAMADAAIDTKGAWTQLGADTTRRHSGLAIGMDTQETVVTNDRHRIDIGIDPAGGTSYTVVIPDVYVDAGSNESMRNYGELFLPSLLSIDIPVGSAIAARSQSSAANANSNLGIAVYGL